MTPILTVSKRFEFAASHKIAHPDWSDAENMSIFGQDSVGTFGHGHNFVVNFQFQGPVDPVNGMVVELSTIKSRVNDAILSRYDHYYLNQIDAYRSTIPTVEAMASNLLRDAQLIFNNDPFFASGVHIQEHPGSSATAYASGRVTRTISAPMRHPLCGLLAFNSPLIVSATVVGVPDAVTHQIELESTLIRYLTEAIDLQIQRPLNDWTEIGTHILDRCPWANRIRIGNAPWAATYFQDGRITVEFYNTYRATHRLAVDSFDEEENRRCFGKCYRPHGHTFEVMTTWAYANATVMKDEARDVDAIIATWDKTALHLDDAFQSTPASTEWMILKLWDRLSAKVPLLGLRLLETPNNRFSLRKDTSRG